MDTEGNPTFEEILSMRRSVRKYSGRSVADEEIEIILDAARVAPSSNNTQPWRFIIVRDSETIERLSKTAPFGTSMAISFIAKAPCVIVCCAEPKAIYHKAVKRFVPADLAFMDVTIATEHIVLAAAKIGFGVCWMGWVSPKKLKKLLDLPGKWESVALLAVGWPERQLEIREPKRKSLSEIVFRESPKIPWGRLEKS